MSVSEGVGVGASGKEETNAATSSKEPAGLPGFGLRGEERLAVSSLGVAHEPAPVLVAATHGGVGLEEEEATVLLTGDE